MAEPWETEAADGRIVIEDYPQPEVRLDYFGGASGTYAGFDRFGRVIQQLWYDHGASEERDKFSYGFDRNSSRLYRKNELSATRSELYHVNNAAANTEYDGLNRLKEFRRGTLDDPPDSIADGNTTRRQVFTLDEVGNWTNFKSDAGDGSTWDVDQDRTHNDVNEITQIEASATHVAYSARGNMTKAPKPDDVENHHYNCTYDAWNRLVKVQDDAGTPATVAEYQYDGTNRRIVKLIPDGENWDRTDYYHQTAWQVVEERYANDQASKTTVATEPKFQYVWSVRYIDAGILRDENTDTDGLCDDDRVYYVNDANMNVTTLVDTAGDAQERYVYDPYGEVTIYNSDWSATVTWANSKKNEILYCGYRYNEETKLYHVCHRVYHPTLGRWVQRDALGYMDVMSLYEYAQSSPLLYTDPWGLLVIYAEGATHVAKDPSGKTDLAKLSEKAAKAFSEYARRTGQIFHFARHRPSVRQDLSLAGAWNDTRMIANNAIQIFDDMIKAAEKGEEIFIFAHSTGSATILAALEHLNAYNRGVAVRKAERPGCKKMVYVKSIVIYAGTVSRRHRDKVLNISLKQTFMDTAEDVLIIQGGKDWHIDLSELLGNADQLPGKCLGQIVPESERLDVTVEAAPERGIRGATIRESLEPYWHHLTPFLPESKDDPTTPIESFVIPHFESRRTKTP